MQRKNFRVPYLIGLIILLAVYNPSTFNFQSFPVVITFFAVGFVVGLLGVYIFAENRKLYKNLYLWSYLLTFGFLFLPGLGSYAEADSISYGFPSQWVTYDVTWGRSDINLAGFSFNFLTIYAALRLSIFTLRKLLSVITPKEA